MAKVKDETSQGGGYHGGPKRWTGTGPRPARHVPWPELFKHHQSVLTGHLKMMDMVRKHCVPGTGNYDTADACVKRTQEMLHDFKNVAFSFVPPKDNIDRVPLGASSASMYPGYSPADHIYGEASQEFGSQVAEIRKKGMDWKPEGNGPEYVVGQSKVSERQQREQYQKQRSMSAQSETTLSGEPAKQAEKDKSEDTPLWFVDPNPTPINVADKASKKGKRRVSFRDDDEVNNHQETHKKKKTKSSDPDSKTPEPVEQDDISGEVESRLEKNEEKRKKKEDKKRKREEGDSSLLAEETGIETVKTDKPKQKKHKAQEPVVAVEAQSGVEEKAGKKEKRLKTKRENTEESADGVNGDVDDGEKRKKKRKKDP